MKKREEITDIINDLKTRYTPENFKKMGIKKGKVLTFDYEGSPVVLEVTKVAKGRYWAKHIKLHEPNVVASHYRHNVDATDEATKEYGSPFCTDCEMPVSQVASVQGILKYEERKERYLSDGTPIKNIEE